MQFLFLFMSTTKHVRKSYLVQSMDVAKGGRKGKQLRKLKLQNKEETQNSTNTITRGCPLITSRNSESFLNLAAN